VYLLGTDRGAGRDDRRASRIERRGGDVGFVLLGWPEPGLPVLAAERALVEAAERVRLLYVAITRAKQRLVLGIRNVAPVEWRRAVTQAALLAHGKEPAGWPDVAVRADGMCLRDAQRTLWRVVDPPERPRVSAAHEPALLPEAARLAREHEELCALREAAALRAARVSSTTASEEGHAREERVAAAAGDDESPPRREGAGDDSERRVALAAGTALHAVLESLDWADADALQPARALAALERAVATAAPPGESQAVLARARSVWERFAAGPLLARLRALAPHVVARELPVWAAPAGDTASDPVGFVAGAIDLLYRDPASGELAVADYKTDAVEGAALEERAQSYASQGAVYTRAVTAALGLTSPPRFELWFLAAGEVRIVGA
jgi:ATP-dependent exoDNAse (exonuclease V) beta subunit